VSNRTPPTDIAVYPLGFLKNGPFKIQTVVPREATSCRSQRFPAFFPGLGIKTMNVPGHLDKAGYGKSLQILHDGFKNGHRDRLSLNVCKSSGQKGMGAR
jgi:hypothetical protein